MKVLETNPVTIAEVKDILTAKEKQYAAEEEELFHEQKRALEHAKAQVKDKGVKSKDSKAMVEKLSALELELSGEQAVKIADLLPASVDDVRAIFAKERFKYSATEIQQIIDVVAQYR